MAKASIGKLISGQLSNLRKQIGQHEKTLRTLKKEEKDLLQAARLLSGKGAGARKLVRGKSKGQGRTKTKGTGGRINWDATLKRLPDSFTMDDLARTRGAKGKSRAYLHQIINRWKKANAIKAVGRAKYQKA